MLTCNITKLLKLIIITRFYENSSCDKNNEKSSNGILQDYRNEKMFMFFSVM